MGYLPGIGIGAAVYRWNFAINDYKRGYIELGLLIGHLVRGIFEFLGGGLAIGLLLDLPVSLYRHLSHRENKTSDNMNIKKSAKLYDLEL